jgi:hypothetical protein
MCGSWFILIPFAVVLAYAVIRPNRRIGFYRRYEGGCIATLIFWGTALASGAIAYRLCH